MVDAGETAMRIPPVFQIIVLVLVLEGIATAQSADRLQAGLQFTALYINKLGEGAAGVGGRLTYDLLGERTVLSLEGEFNYFPQNPSGNFGESQLLGGIKLGFAGQGLGLFAKVRPGLVRFAGADFAARNHGSAINFALDAGGVLEFRLSHRAAFRADWGDTMILFPNPVFTGASAAPAPAGLTHNFQGSIGMMFRF